MGRVGTAEWKGDLKEGSGTMGTASGALTDTPYTFKSRFEEGTGTNPEELIAAAHAGCFAMALSNILAGHGHNPESVQARADATLKMVDGTPTITKIALEVVGNVPGLDEDHFKAHAEEAKAGCVVSRALAAVDEITLDARLAS